MNYTIEIAHMLKEGKITIENATDQDCITAVKNHLGKDEQIKITPVLADVVKEVDWHPV